MQQPQHGQNFLISAAANYVAYHSADNITVSPDTIEKSSRSKAFVIVVSKQYYVEWVKKYPIADLSELRSVLKQQQAGKLSFYKISPVHNRQRIVQCWEMSEQLSVFYPQAYVWIPETWLFAESLLPGEVGVYHSAGRDTYISKHDGVVVSSAAGPLISDAQLFCSAHGLPYHASRHLALDNMTVLSHLQRLPLSDWATFFRFNTDNTLWAKLKPAVLFSAGIYLLYTAGVSVYLWSANQQYQLQLDNQREQISARLDIQTRLQQSADLLAVQRQILQEKTIHFPLWLVLDDVLKLPLQLQSFELTNGSVVLRGNAVSALNVLNLLQKHSLVTKAEFDSAVRRQGDYESFVIRFGVKQGQPNEQK